MKPGIYIALSVLFCCGCRRSAPLAAADPSPILKLTEVAQSQGLRYRYSEGGKSPLNIVQMMGAGAGFLDVDNDGWLDVLCVGYPAPALFHNEKGHGFTDVTERSGLGRKQGHWYGCATGDYDNDGFVDVYLTGFNQTALFHNNGDGTFTDVTEQAGVGLHRWASSAAFADVNRDGRLDLYVACYAHFAPGMPEFHISRGVPLSLGPDAYEAEHGVLFLNDGGGRFHDATKSSGLDDSHGKGLGVAFADVDNNGRDDLVVANDQEPVDFYQNDGRGHFTNVAVENGTALTSEGKKQGGMGVDFGDYAGEGRLDLFVANFADEPKSLYHNLGHDMFENTGYAAGISQTTRPWVAFGCRFVDLDQDGRLDLAIVNGHVQDLIQKADPNMTYPQEAQLFLNQGSGRFREVSDQVGPDFRVPMVARALATGDFDNDGKVDLLVANLGGTPRLFRNEGGPNQGNWLTVQLTGSRSNRMAIGARLELLSGGAHQIREVRTDGSYLAAQDPRVHFGIGRASVVDELRIRWPSGQRQTLKSLAVNRLLKIREP